MKNNLQSHTPHVQSVMSKKLITLNMEDSVRTAYQLMQEHRFRHLPIKDSAGNIMGILSDRDVQRAMKTTREGLEVQIEFNPEDRCQDYMQWPVQTCSEATTIHEAVDYMLKEKISAFLVMDETGKRARGILTTDDLLKLLKEVLSKDPQLSKKNIQHFDAEWWSVEGMD